jgi:two-component system nitrogen regulation response regulator NtrX
MSAGNILVVDDEPEIRRLVKEVLEDESYQVITADGADTAQDELEKLHADLVLLDIWMPNTDGMALLQKWAESGGLPCPVVMMSGHGNIETAVEALKLGAYDFIEKPVSMAKLLVTVQRALQTENLRKENLRLKRRTETGTELIAASPAMLQLKEDIERVAPTDFWVLISGEPGSGKAIAARYLHSHSTRKNGPLVEISLAATPKENMAIQLFGSGEGENISPGSFEQAEGGILLLDEIGDLDLDTQGRLVSALEDNRFIRVGGTTVIEMNVRIVATTQHDLAAEVKAGKFREDLFYRLNVVPLKVPPLRERLEDIEPLCRQYVDWLTEFEHLPRKHFSDQAINALKRYSWPGNVRELKNVIQRLMILCRNVEINAEDVRKAIGYDLGTTEELAGNFDQTLRSARDEFERAYILYHLERNNGNVSALADRSGMERTHLYRKLKQLGINPKTLKNK